MSNPVSNSIHTLCNPRHSWPVEKHPKSANMPNLPINSYDYDHKIDIPTALELIRSMSHAPTLLPIMLTHMHSIDIHLLKLLNISPLTLKPNPGTCVFHRTECQHYVFPASVQDLYMFYLMADD